MPRKGEHNWTEPGEDTTFHGHVIGYDDVRLEQVDVPDDVVALISVGHEIAEHYNSAGNRRARTHIEAEPIYLTSEDAIEVGLLLLEAAQYGRSVQATDDEGPINRMSDEQRWRAHVIACGLQDMTFWVQGTDAGYTATEIETGVTAAPGVTQREALENYFNHRYAD